MEPTSETYRYIVCSAGVRSGDPLVLSLLQNGETVTLTANCFLQLTRSQVYECLAHYEDHRYRQHNYDIRASVTGVVEAEIDHSLGEVVTGAIAAGRCEFAALRVVRPQEIEGVRRSRPECRHDSYRRRWRPTNRRNRLAAASGSGGNLRGGLGLPVQVLDGDIPEADLTLTRDVKGNRPVTHHAVAGRRVRHAASV